MQVSTAVQARVAPSDTCDAPDVVPAAVADSLADRRIALHADRVSFVAAG
jgi:hypothetical protein